MYPIAETKKVILGVEGRMCTIHAPQEVRGRLVHLCQKWVSESRPVTGFGANGEMRVEIRFDDDCKKGHQSFAITAEVRTNESRRRRDIAAGGCMHDDIAKNFPELEPLIKYHLMGTDSPMHYVANTVYHASNRDHNGRLAGEPTSFAYGIRFGDSPITMILKKGFYDWLVYALDFNSKASRKNPNFVKFVPKAVEHQGEYNFDPKYTFEGYDVKWHECPFDNVREAEEFSAAMMLYSEFVKIPTSFSKGKERDFDAARKTGVWPDATDEQLSLPSEELTKLLNERLPTMIDVFRQTMESNGLLWEPEQKGD